MVWGNSYVYTANTSVATSVAIQTNKLRISSTVPILVITGGMEEATNINTNGRLIPAGKTNRSFYVGQGNYVSFVALSGTGYVSFTELGGPDLSMPFNEHLFSSLTFNNPGNSGYVALIL